MIRKNSFGRTDNLTRHSFFHSFSFCFIQNYSHSVVPGGFEVKSYNTRVIPGTFKNIVSIEIDPFDGSKLENKEECAFPMVMRPEVCLDQYRDDDYRQDAPHFRIHEKNLVSNIFKNSI